MYVLILILLEYGLQPKTGKLFFTFGTVLILILLEYGLQQCFRRLQTKESIRLNPYSTGIWSATVFTIPQEFEIFGVLILILLEYGLQRGGCG